MRMSNEPVTSRYLAGFYAARIVVATRGVLQQNHPAPRDRARSSLIGRLRDAGRRLLDRLRHVGKAGRQRRIPITTGAA